MANIGKQAYFTVMKYLHQRPVIFTSFTVGGIGYLIALARITSKTESDVYTYIRQNPIDLQKVYDYTVDDEVYLLLTTPLEKIPVNKRRAWQHLGSVEPLFKQLNELSPEDQVGPASEQLKRQYRAACHRFMYTMAKENGFITEAQRLTAEAKAFKNAQLPTPEPISVRQWPIDY